MAYQGYLLKISDWEFPLNLIAWDSYSVTQNVIDLDPYRDGNGKLHRNALVNTPVKLKFKTVDNVTSDRFDAAMTNISSRYTNKLEKKCRVTMFVPEIGNYLEQDMYIKDIEINIKSARDGKLVYDAIEFTFVGY